MKHQETGGIEEVIPIRGAYIKLDQFLKWAGLSGTGSEAKTMIEAGRVVVNREVEIRRGRKLYPGDVVTVMERTWRIDADPAENR